MKPMSKISTQPPSTAAVPEGHPRSPKGYVQNLEQRSLANTDFRRVLYTAKNLQLVVMSLQANESIGEEVHDVDQFFRFEAGSGTLVLEGQPEPIGDGVAVIVPARTRHDIINTGAGPLKFYTLYAPPHHRDGVVHHTREEAEADEEQYDFATTEVV